MESRFFEITDPVLYVRNLADLEKELGFPGGSLVTLVFNIDDWRFIIHGHALVEGAVSQMLASALDERLVPVFEQLELGKSDTGKLEFAKALGLLTDEKRGFIRILSRLRNVLAHDLRHLNFDLEAHITSMNPQQGAAFFKHFGFGLDEPRRSEWLAYARKHPKYAMASGIIRIVEGAINEGKVQQINREESAHALRQVIRGELIPPDDPR